METVKTASKDSPVEVAAGLADLFASRAEQHERSGTFPYENYADLRRSSYHTASVPLQYGGWGLSIGQLTRSQARLGEGCASTALVIAMQLAQIGRIALMGWPPEQIEKIMTGVVKKGYMVNSAASEPATGSPSRGGIPTTQAVAGPDGGYTITGRKTYTTGAPVLHYIIISAAVKNRADNAATPPVSNFLLERDLAGLRIEETWNALSLRLSGSHDLVLDEVAVGPQARIQLPKPSPQQSALNAAWGLPVAAVYFGIGRAAAKYAAGFAHERKPNSLDKSIAELSHIQEKAGRMELALLAAENTLFAVADLADNGEATRNPARLTALVGAAKQLATNHALEAVDLAMRIVGAASLSMNSPLQRYYRDARAGLSNPPMDDASTLLLGKLALGLL